MYQFFVDASQIHVEEKRVIITGGDVNHIRNVLRMKPGEEICVSNGEDGKEYRCGILSMQEDAVLCELRFIKEDATELPCRITLFQGLPKADKMELIVQKCVELGVAEIVPVSMKRCVMKLEDKKAAAKVARWQAIAEAAAKQSKRGIIPKIAMPMTFGLALEYAATMERKLLPYEMAQEMQEKDALSPMEQTRKVIGSIKPGDQVAIFIGPEGGFDDSEVSKALGAGAEVITLGKRILRTETAGFVTLSLLMYHLEQ